MRLYDGKAEKNRCLALSSPSRWITISEADYLALAAVPTFARKAIESVTVIIAPPIAAMLIAVGTAINRCRAEPTDHSNGRNIDSHSQIWVCFGGNTGAGTRNYQSSARCNR
jgi:hypothetical protein